MDTEGRRLLAKYYDVPHQGSDGTPSSQKSQLAFERTLHTRTSAQPDSTFFILYDMWLIGVVQYGVDGVVMVGGSVAVYRANLDLVVWVVGSSDQNEMVLACALETFYETLSEMLK